MTRVMITGATTRLGGATVSRLLADAEVEHVLAVGREDFPHELPDHPRLTYVDTDLSRPRRIRELLFGLARELGVTTVIHAAVHRDPRATGRSVHKLNVDATRDLLTLIDRHPTIERFIYRSTGTVYRVDGSTPALIGEDAPLELRPHAPQWLRDRVEADLTVCTRMGLAKTRITVLRLAELLAPACGGQIWDYLQSRVCLRPVGFDPMINLLSLTDAAEAFARAVAVGADGVFNIPGADTLPLSVLTTRWGRTDLPLPGPLLAPLYRLRQLTTGAQFRYELHAGSFHFGRVLDGSRAREVLGYVPHSRVPWPGGDQASVSAVTS